MQPDQGNHGKTIIKEGNKELLLEGKAKIYTKYIEKNTHNQMVENQVFYNPVQIFNRDFTLLVIQLYINRLKKQNPKFQGVNIVDALSASGLRTIRFLKELEGVNMVYANDLSPASHKLMKDNFSLNNLDPSKYKMTLEDANVLLRNSQRQFNFDIIDLDPYGSVVPFLDSSIESIKEGGLLCITCTDTRVLCGCDFSKCFYFYGSTRARVQDFNQNALRILLSTISAAASRHCKYIEPLISLQTDFYVRVFVVVRKGKLECSESGTKIGNIFNCNACGNYQYEALFKRKKEHFVPNRKMSSSANCTNCQEPYQINGPVWLARINNQTFAKDLLDQISKKDFQMELKTKKKIYGILHGIVSEGDLADIPLGFNFDLMNKTIKSTGLSKKALTAAVESLGKQYKVISSYISPGFYKTNLPLTAIYDIIKSWKLKDMKEEKYLTNVSDQFRLKILQKEIQFKPDFQYKSQDKIKYIPKFISMGKGMGPKGKPLKRILNESMEQNEDEDEKEQKMNMKQSQNSLKRALRSKSSDKTDKKEE